MARGRRRGKPKHNPAPDARHPEDANGEQAEQPEGAEEAEGVAVGEWSQRRPPRWREFPGPRATHVPLRVACERQAHAELVAHAKDSLDAEVCGVLVGDVCEDDRGLFVHVRHIIRGAAADTSSSHVTFTQETWRAIHETLERDFRKMQILGWYHSHPGFGVEFSEMDLFIQRNFFAAPTQVALVVDPVSGDEALCVNRAEGIRPIDRFWIEGRVQQCRAPAGAPSDETAGPAAPSGSTEVAIKDLQDRVNQLIQTLDDQHAGVYRMLLSFGMFVALAIVMWIGWSIYLSYTAEPNPHRPLEVFSRPIRIGDKTIKVGIGVVTWDVPPEIDPTLQLDALKKRIREAAAAAKEAEERQKAPGKGARTPAAPNSKS